MAPHPRPLSFVHSMSILHPIPHLRVLISILSLGVLVSLLGSAHAQEPNALHDSLRTVAYVGGQVWDGEQFTERSLLVRDGAFVSADAEPDTTVDLGGGYVVPPYGDAHTHNLGAGGYSQLLADSLYMRRGIFYAADMTNPYSNIEKIRDTFKQPTTLDVTYTMGGLTAPGSHPGPIMENIYGDDIDSTWSLEGDAYWFMRSTEDVANQWSAFMEQDPDLVKVYVMYARSGRDIGRADGRDECGYGLCPDVLRDIVTRAHEADKRVFAHINTAEDARVVMEAGVDALAHHPLGNDGISIDESGPFTLQDETIQQASRQGVAVVPTAFLLVEDLDSFRADTLQQEIALQREQIRALHDTGVPIALSGHNWQVTSVQEALYFHAYSFFDNATLLNLWSRTTPQVIFPDRQIGRLTEGYEASFLVLSGNPIEDFEHTQDIRLRVKEGYILP